MVNEGNFNNINLCKKNFIWVDDNLITKCYKCLCDFSIINRKHHCRICGKIFCAECTKYYILSPFLNSENILDIDTYLDYLTKYTDKKTEYHRACLACKNNYNYIEKYKDKIKSLESLKISILDYKNLMNVNEEWYMSVKIFLNRISHIQYYLPNTTYKKFESNFLIRNIKYLIGHNKWIVHLIKSQNWEHMKPKRKNAIINGIRFLKPIMNCKDLYCIDNCSSKFQDEDIIDIILHVTDPDIQSFFINYLNNIFDYIQILVYSIQFESKKYQPISKFLINNCVKSNKLFNYVIWETSIYLNNKEYYSYYTKFIQKLKSEYLIKKGSSNFKKYIDSTKIFKIIDTHSNINKCIKKCDNIIKTNSVDLTINPELNIIKIVKDKIKFKNSSSQPLNIPFICKKNNNNTNILYQLIYKKEDVRKDQLVCNIINIMDNILKTNGYDFHIITYNVLPLSKNSGIIEVVPQAKTIYHIKEKMNYSIQNYILECNTDKKVDVVKLKFIKSMAAYCVITYLLGIGDRHLDNIMISRCGALFHIDFSFLLGYEPKPLAPSIRIIPEMIDVIGGIKSNNYQIFVEQCKICYNILKKHCNLFINLFSILPNIDNNFDNSQITKEILKRFLPDEEIFESGILVESLINSSQNSYNFIDFFHFYYKETSILEPTKSYIKNIFSFS